MLCEKMVGKKLDLSLVVLGTLGMSLFTLDLFLIGKPIILLQAPGAFIGISGFLAIPGAIRIVFDLLMVSIFSGLYIVPLYTLMQIRTQVEIRSRIIAANNVLNALFMVSSAILLMQLIKFRWSVPQIFMVLAILNLAFMSFIFAKEPEFLSSFNTRLKAVFKRN